MYLCHNPRARKETTEFGKKEILGCAVESIYSLVSKKKQGCPMKNIGAKKLHLIDHLLILHVVPVLLCEKESRICIGHIEKEITDNRFKQVGWNVTVFDF